MQTVLRETSAYKMLPFDGVIRVDQFTFTVFGWNVSYTQEFYFHATTMLIRSVGRDRRCEEESEELEEEAGDGGGEGGGEDGGRRGRGGIVLVT